MGSQDSFYGKREKTDLHQILDGMTVTENTRIFNKGIQKLRIEEERLIKIRKLRGEVSDKIPIYKKNVPNFVS